MKKGIIAGISAVVLLGGGIYGMKSVSAEEVQPPQKVIKVADSGNKLAVREQYSDKFHQINQLREERLDLRKQIINKKDQLIDLFIAAKNSGSKEDLKQAKDVKQQLKSINSELKTLLTEGKNERQDLKDALKNKNGDASEQFNKLMATQQQMNEKLKDKMNELDKMIEVFN